MVDNIVGILRVWNAIKIRGWGGSPIGIKIADYFLAASAAGFSFHFPRNEPDATTDWIQFRDAKSPLDRIMSRVHGVDRFSPRWIMQFAKSILANRLRMRNSCFVRWKRTNLKDTRLEGTADISELGIPWIKWNFDVYLFILTVV